MGRKPASFVNIEDYCSAYVAASIKSIEYGRRIDPCRINKWEGIRKIPINKTTNWYHRGDIENYQIRGRRRRCKRCGSLDCSGH